MTVSDPRSSTLNSRSTCPKCHSREFKPWSNLDRDELIAAEARFTKYTRIQRKKYRICTRCWFEQVDRESDIA